MDADSGKRQADVRPPLSPSSPLRSWLQLFLARRRCLGVEGGGVPAYPSMDDYRLTARESTLCSLRSFRPGYSFCFSFALCRGG